MSSIRIGDFKVVNPPYEYSQDDLIIFLIKIFSESCWHEDCYSKPIEEYTQIYTKLLNKLGCSDKHISKRYSFIPDFNKDKSQWKVFDGSDHLTLGGWKTRTQLFNKCASEIFDDLYKDHINPPHNIVHVTCTSYESPSAGQITASKKGWNNTKITQVYHHGCYGAIPALRVSQGLISTALLKNKEEATADIIHTELHTVHADPSRRTPDQIVGHSLFGDGVISYKMWGTESGYVSDERSLEIMAIDEYIIPDSSELMSWSIVESGMHMVLDKHIPDSIAANINNFVIGLYEKAGISYEKEFNNTLLAIHPGGPKILDKIRDAMNIEESRMSWSRKILYERGNLSSATVPHIWSDIINSDVKDNTIVLSLAFGPGLTAAGSIMVIRNK